MYVWDDPPGRKFSRYGISDDWLAAFMMSSILLNPQLILYSMALGTMPLAIRIASCFLCGIAAGLLIRFAYQEKAFFRDTDPDPLLRFLKNLGRNVKATGPMFLLGVALSALFQRYVPSDLVADLFGDNRGFGVLMAATIGVPLYAMITGPATKITNLGAVKIVLGTKRFAAYLVFTVLFALLTGWIVDLIV